MNYILLIMTLSFSCDVRKSTEGETNKFASIATSKTDTLKFTSGIRSIFQDSRGNYWFGSIREGVALYNGISFTYFSTNDGLIDNQILSIQEDKNGNIWFESQNGVCSYDGISIQDETKGIAENSEDNWTKSEHELWFGAGMKEGVYRFDGHQLSYLAFPDPKVINPNNLYGVTSISKGKNNMIWLGTYAGVFGYDGKEFKVINDETLGLDIEVEPLHIRSVLEDSKGRLWIGNNGIGVWLIEGDSTIHFSDRNKLIHPTSGRKGDKSMPGTMEHVFTMAEDRDGNIWFGDRDAGIWKYDGVVMTNYTKKDGLTNDNALSIYKDHQGELWFGMEDGKVYKFNGKTFERPF
ncbi:MAG: diguanylate cyclase [Flavobacteriales bacterium]|nr:diguanylate cyclase [Flavobacteriales bacterium]